MLRKTGKPEAPRGSLNFAALVEAVRQVHEHSAAAASRAVNVSLTLRNWTIGCYIREYEQNSVDQAEYGGDCWKAIRGSHDKACRGYRIRNTAVSSN